MAHSGETGESFVSSLIKILMELNGPYQMRGCSSIDNHPHNYNLIFEEDEFFLERK